MATRQKQIEAMIEIYWDDIFNRIPSSMFALINLPSDIIEETKTSLKQILQTVAIAYDKSAERLDLESIDPSQAFRLIQELSFLALLLYAVERRTGGKVVAAGIVEMVESAKNESDRLPPEDNARFQKLIEKIGLDHEE